MTASIEIEALCKNYRTVTALDNIHLTLDTTESIGLVGKNGAGKTTLMSILCGAIRQTSGTVRVLGEIPGSSRTIGRLSILLQDANFKRGVPVLSQLHHYARLQGLSKDHARQQVGSLLESLNNADYADKKPETLSYGQRKRLGIVQALIGEPELVLLDEPTAGLDPIAASDIRGFIQGASRQRTFIISSHNLHEIEDVCSRIIVLDRGRLITNSKIADFSGKDVTLKLQTDRPVGNELKTKLSQLHEITEIIVDESHPEKLTIVFATEITDALQLQVQTLIVEHGAGIVQLNRGKALADGVVDLVSQQK